ncbi:hypothetical protein [Streptomyces violascens]|uniref:hypothetical protein n=1 Tax=Streptomyces violascens TaxID=67381 RepID=UPI0016785979|nr:hypothetical protein [Streptomyces violascens]GGU42991.1 hypothetical protein GCM10010289_74750 [Streptomyces violascens]
MRHGQLPAPFAEKKKEILVELSKSELAVQDQPVVKDAAGGIAALTVPSSVVRIEDVEEEGGVA